MNNILNKCALTSSTLVFIIWIGLGLIQDILIPFIMIPVIPLLYVCFPLVFVFLSFYILNFLLLNPSSKFSLISIATFSSFFIIVTLTILANSDSDYNTYIITFSLRWLIYLTIGFAIAHALINNQVFIDRILKVLWLIVVIFAVINFDIERVSIPYYNLYFQQANLNIETAVIKRHFFTDYFALLSLYYAYYYKNKQKAFLTFGFISFIVLFMLGGRASFLAFTLVYALWCFKYFKTSLLMVTLMLFPLLLVFHSSLFELYLNSHMANLSEDKSVIARDELFNRALLGIIENPIIGDYGGQTEYGSKGGYMHNVLSYYRQFGLLAFFSYLLLLGTSVIYLIKLNRTLIYLCLFFLINIFFAKSLFWGMEWMLVGAAWAGFLMINNKNSKGNV
jgi:hypothetical protein